MSFCYYQDKYNVIKYQFQTLLLQSQKLIYILQKIFFLIYYGLSMKYDKQRS